ncbi:hypothetical protein CCP4SC76_240009 [Gammaproteobacteria bacterium]
MIVDISLGGIRLDSSKMLAVDQKVKLSFFNMTILAAVRYKVNNMYGLRFDELTTEDTNKLMKLIDGSFYFPIR